MKKKVKESTDRFESERDITRAEFAAILVMGLGFRLNAYQSAPFSDVAQKDWYAQVVQTAFDYKLIAGRLSHPGHTRL